MRTRTIKFNFMCLPFNFSMIMKISSLEFACSSVVGSILSYFNVRFRWFLCKF
jgi:hypothetical protein